MATKTTVLLVDDLDGDTAEETVSFSLDGVEYEIDLNAKNADSIRTALGPFMDAARRVGGRRGPRRATNAPAASASSNGSSDAVAPEDRASIRAWASNNGYKVSDRGRLSREVVSGWLEAGRPAG